MQERRVSDISGAEINDGGSDDMDKPNPSVVTLG